MISKVVEIIPSVVDHVRELAVDMRALDILESERMGLDAGKALFYSYRNSTYRRTALIDGKVAAMWGLYGTLFGNYGVPYLLTGNLVDQISPIKFAKIYKRETDIMKTMFPKLENHVDASYEGAVRMLKLAGYELTGPFPWGKNGELFYKFSLEGSL